MVRTKQSDSELARQDRGGSKPRRPSKNRRRLIWAAVVVIIAIVGLTVAGRMRAGQAGSKLILGQVTRGDLIETVSATGSVNAQTGAEVKIGSQITGQIKRLNADVGSSVKAGQVIAQLDLPDLDAQLQQSRESLAQAETHYAQQLSGVGLEREQTVIGIGQARAGAQSARQKLLAAAANYGLQREATPTDIAKAAASLKVAESAVSTARANIDEVNAASDLAVSNAREQLAQAQANAANAAASEKRLQNLVAKGYVSQADVDNAHAQAQVYASQVRASNENLDLTTKKVALDKQTAQHQFDQAVQTVAAAKASLDAAKAETNTVVAREADVRDAQAAIQQADEALRLAEANRTNDVLKRQDVQAARQAMLQARAAVAYNIAQWNKSLIKSPISGTVLQLSAQQGETLAAGLSAPTLIIVADLKRLQVDAYVDETDIGKVQLWQNAKISVDAFPDRQFDGTVQKIASGSTIQQGVVTYDVTIAIKDPGETLKPDMTANVNIETGRRPNVLLVPAVAVQSGTRGSTVNVLRTVNGRPQTEAVSVVTGGTDGVNVEIVKGLSEGDKIVLAGQAGPTRTAPNPFGPRSGSGSAGAGGGGGGGGGGRG